MSAATTNRIAADDPRADKPVYVAVCRKCGGWSSLTSPEITKHKDGKKDLQRCAAWAAVNDHDFVLIRFGDLDQRRCECRDKPASTQEAMQL